MLRLPSWFSPLVFLAIVSLAPPALAQPAWDSADPPEQPPAVESSPSWEDAAAERARGTDEPSAPEDPASAELAPSVPERTDVPNDEPELDARIEVLDAYLADLQRPVRAHLFGWMGAQVGLIGISAYLAASSDGPSRTGAIVRASISGANLGLMLITPQPGWYASMRYRKMPDGTLEEKRAKLAAGQKWLARQARADKLGTSLARHLLGAVVALGAGAGIMIIHEDGLREAVTTTIGILLVSEAQIATRPRKPRIYNQSYAAHPSGPVQLTLAPLVTEHAQGLALVGQF